MSSCLSMVVVPAAAFAVVVVVPAAAFAVAVGAGHALDERKRVAEDVGVVEREFVRGRQRAGGEEAGLGRVVAGGGVERVARET